MDKKFGLMLVIATALISGVSVFINVWAVNGFDSSVFTFAKNALVAILLFAIILGLGMFPELRNLKKKDWRNLVILGLVGGSIPFLLFFRGIQIAGASAGSFFHKLLFIPVIIFAFLFLRERPSWKVVAGALFLVGGMFFLVLPKLAWSSGILMIGGAVLFWSLDNVFAKHLLKRLSGNLVAFGRMFFGSVFMLAFLVMVGKGRMIWSMSSTQYVWILLTGALLLLFVLTYYNGLKWVKVTTAASVLSLGLPVSIFLDYAFRGVAVTLQSAMGIVLVLAGVLFFIMADFPEVRPVSADGRS
jgi:drug/metabolite transporter (DMT)-like permease